MIRTASRFSPGKQVTFTGMDLFEMRTRRRSRLFAEGRLSVALSARREDPPGAGRPAGGVGDSRQFAAGHGHGGGACGPGRRPDADGLVLRAAHVACRVDGILRTERTGRVPNVYRREIEGLARAGPAPRRRARAARWSRCCRERGRSNGAARLSAVDFAAGGGDVARGVARVDDQRRVPHDEVPVVGRVVGGDQHAVLRGEVLGRQRLAGQSRHVVSAAWAAARECADRCS